MKLDKFFNEFNIIKNGCALLTIALSLLVLSSKSFSASKSDLSPLTLLNSKINDTLQEPLNRVKNVIDLVNLKYQNSLSGEIEAQASRRDFKWIFKADGVSAIKPVVSQDDGTVYVSTADIDITVDLKDLPENGTESVSIGELQGNLYALKPNSIARRGRKKWVFNTEGITIFPPTVSDDKKVFVETIDGSVDIEEKKINAFSAKITGIDDNGVNLWNEPVEFENAVFLGPPVVTSDIVFTTTFTVPDFSNIPDFSDINFKDLSGTISAIDSMNGNIRWSFNASQLDNGSQLFIIFPPVPNGDSIFVSAISPISLEDINELIETTIENVQEEVTTSITDSLLEILDIIAGGGDPKPALNNIEEDIELIIDNTLNNVINEFSDLSRIFALDLDGNVMWESRFPGISLTSPIIADSGLINVNSVNILLDDVFSDIEINVTLTPDGILQANANLALTVAGATIDIGIEFMINLDSEDPLGTLESNIDQPNLDEILDDITIALGGVSSTFNASNGEGLWSTDVNEPIFIKPIVSEDNGQIVVAASNFSFNKDSDRLEINNPISKIYFLDTLSGEIMGESEQFNGTIAPPVLLGPDGSVFFSFFDFEKINIDDLNFEEIFFKVGAVNPDGSTKWLNPYKPDDLVTSAPVINQNDGMVFLSMSKTKDLIDQDEPDPGKRQKLRDLGPDLEGVIIGLDPSNGSVDKSIEVNGLPIASPAIDARRDTIYATGIDFDIGKRPVSVDFLSFIHASILRQ